MSKIDKKVILVVDDQKVHHVVLKAMLENEVRGLGRYQKCRVMSAYSGEECLELLSCEKRIDLILLDIDMPGIQGDEVIRKIRKNEDWSVKVLALTACEKFLDREVCAGLGFDGYIGKPYGVESMVGYLLRFLN